MQGEGANAGRPAVFCRFSGCNLWTGRGRPDRPDAICDFCDTEFVGVGLDGGKFATARALAEAVAEPRWPSDSGRQSRFVVCTGGEPLLQLDQPAVEAFHAAGFTVAVETNGTQVPPAGIDWVCVSPKARADLILRAGNELKLVFPQPGLDPEQLRRPGVRPLLSSQPMDGPNLEVNTRAALTYCLGHPRWRLSLQTHKMLGIR